MIRLIAFDLDGTLLDNEKKIPAENREALIYAMDRGVELVPATGRIPRAIPPFLLELPRMHYCIAANGSCIYDYQQDRTIHRAEIPLDRALEIIDYARELGVDCDCYQDNAAYASDDLFANPERSVTLPHILALFRSTRKPVGDLREYLAQKGEPLQKLQYYFTDPELRLRMLEELPKRFPDCSITTSMSINIEINAAAANKGQALQELCRICGIPPRDTMAFGDDTNDRTMLQAAGLGIAMGNAKPELKALADAVTLDNTSAGVARSIYEHIPSSVS